MQIKIKRKGCYDSNGHRIPVGTVLTMEEEPKGWLNKYERLDSEEEAVGPTLADGEPSPSVNPNVETDDNSAQTEEEELAARYKALSGGEEPDRRWGVKKLRAEVERLSDANAE